MSIDARNSDIESKRDIPSFIEPRPPLILNPFMRPRPQTGINLMEYFEEEYSDSDEPEWVQVYLRLKPCDIRDRNNLYEVRSDRHLITSVDTATAGHGRRTQHNVSKMYTFSRIFGAESNQRDIFETVVKDNLKKLPEGQNFTLLTYGASGSGKTFTLMGTVSSPGLVPRSLEYVFRIMDAAQTPLYKPGDGAAEKLSNIQQDYELQSMRRLRQLSAGSHRDKYRRTSIRLRNDLTASSIDLTNRTKYYVWVSFVEIYNEGIYDLLTNCDRSKSTSKLRIREDSNGNAYVKGATQAFVRSDEEAYDVLMAGKHNLQVAATGVHAHSSRSHCIFSISVLAQRDGGVTTSCVRLCDLAGCERARQTRNTGARMLESRAINTSLHVLERCLRMLKRKQRHADTTLVPYRESKLTRLLGAGLSGARLEAVSMVVTLNPAPQCAHETRHVLQLAAVARDIQVNSTIAESLESSAQDTIVDSSEQVMRLRAENERLHYELIQAQSCIKEQTAAMDEGQRETARQMSVLVEQAKEMTKDLYEFQMGLLRNEMEEMRDEYETRLKEMEEAEGGRRTSAAGTPSRGLQQKVSQLMAEAAILQEQLAAEQLARSRLEDQVQHLLACIEERDEKAGSPDNDEEMIISDDDDDSKSDEESDPDNESLEPTFSKKKLNRTRLMLQQSGVDDDNNVTEISDSDDDDLNVTAKEYNRDNEEIEVVEKFVESCDNENDSGFKSEHNVKDSVSVKETSLRKTYFVKDVDSSDRKTDLERSVEANVSKLENPGQEKARNLSRETYFVNEFQSSNNKENTVNKSPKDHYEYSGKNNTDAKKNILVIRNDNLIMSESDQNKLDTKSLKFGFLDKKKAESKKKIIDSRKENKVHEFNRKSSILTHASDISLAQFEELEMAAKHDSKSSDMYTNINMLTEKLIFFDDKPTEKSDIELIKISKEKKTYFNIIDVNTDSKHATDTNPSNALGDDRSPSIVKDDVSKDFEPNSIKKLLGESFTRPETVTSTLKTADVVRIKKNASVDIFEGFESPNVNHAHHKTTEKVLAVSSTTEDAHTTVSKQKVDLMEPVLDTNVSAETNNITESYKPCKLKDIFDCKSLVIPPFQSVRTEPVATEQELKTKSPDFLTSEAQSDLEDEVVNVDANRNPIETAVSHRELDIENVREQENEPQLQELGELLTEIANVTLDETAEKKLVRDIPSPENDGDAEYVPPGGIQSCPSKILTRSRRKLFTPRAEPLEESPGDGDAAGVEPRLRAPRPSYHRAARVRRKL